MLFKVDLQAPVHVEAVHAQTEQGSSPPFNLFQYFWHLHPSSFVEPFESVPKAIHQVSQMLDRLWSLETQLSWAEKTSCTVKIAWAGPALAIELGFFHYQARSKFDLLLHLTDTLALAGFTHHYGPISAEHLADPVQLALVRAAPHECIRKVVAAVTEVLENNNF